MDDLLKDDDLNVDLPLEEDEGLEKKKDILDGEHDSLDELEEEELGDDDEPYEDVDLM